MSERKLATIRRIDEIYPIEGADAIELAVIGGWKVVVKKNEFVPGDLVRYFEIDSWIPDELAPFLTKQGQYPKVYEGIAGQRLKTIKLRGQISQGLVIRADATEQEGDDVTEKLGILKWEPPAVGVQAANAKGNFPSFLRKTDQERVQNLSIVLRNYQDCTFEVTEKLDGSSMTVFVNDSKMGVCSRNLELKMDESSTMVDLAKKLTLWSLPEGFAVQGEIVGPGIQQNKYKLTDYKYFIYDVFYFGEGLGFYLDPETARTFVENHGLTYVPVINPAASIEGLRVDDFLEDAEGKSVLHPSTEREGLVYKLNTKDGLVGRQESDFSFKAISNRFLLKNGD